MSSQNSLLAIALFFVLGAATGATSHCIGQEVRRVPQDSRRIETRTMEAGDFFSENRLLQKLCEAIDAGDLKATKLAISEGADVKAAGRFGLTALHWTIFAMQCDLDGIPDRSPIVLELLERGASANVRCRPESDEWVKGLNEKLLLGVHRYGPCSPQGAAPIHLAAGAVRNQGALISKLIEHGADINLESSGPGKKTSLHWAVSTSNYGAVRQLVGAGVDVTKRDGYGQLPLDLVYSYRVAVVLLENQAPFERKPALPFDMQNIEQPRMPFLFALAGEYDSILNGREPLETDAVGWREYANFWRAVTLVQKAGIDVEKVRMDLRRARVIEQMLIEEKEQKE